MGPRAFHPGSARRIPAARFAEVTHAAVNPFRYQDRFLPSANRRGSILQRRRQRRSHSPRWRWSRAVGGTGQCARLRHGHARRRTRCHALRTSALRTSAWRPRRSSWRARGCPVPVGARPGASGSAPHCDECAPADASPAARAARRATTRGCCQSHGPPQL